MFPYSSGFDLSRLNALRQMLYGHPGGGIPGIEMPAPTWGGTPPMAGPYPGAAVPGTPPDTPVNEPMPPIRFMGPPQQAPGGMPPVHGTGLPPMVPGPQFPNLQALHSLAPQSQLRRPLTGAVR